MRYLAALSASSYSYISLLKHFLPIMNPGGASLSLTYIASERIIPGYGGGISSTKSALESDTRVLAFEAGRKHKVRVNTISAGPLRSCAAKAIGFIDMMIDYSIENAPLQKELSAGEVGNAAAFLASPLASAIMGAVVYVDNGLMQWEWELTAQCLRILTTPKTRAMRLLNKLFLCEFVQILTSKISNGLSIACHFLFSCPSNRPVD
nr:enoyl-[acyl-carrier-protein] reductase [NADH], chloroplastic-like [Ipomoea batatas]